VFAAGEKGWGVRTLEDVAADQLIIEYVGEVIGARQKAERMKAVSSSQCAVTVTETVCNQQW
jgi:SET domain-containing protein